MPAIAFATCRDRPGLTADDARVVPHLAAGLDLVAVPWDEPGRDWRAFDAVVLRSTWDYHLKRDEFERWLNRLDGDGVTVWNPTAVVRWNLEKTYLRDLTAAAVATPPTVWLAPGEPADLATVLAERGWDRVVVKPTVGATSWGLFIAESGTAKRRQGELTSTLARGGVMIQPLLEEVGRDGEWSLVVLGGELSHAVVKRARDGEVRVQSDYGGSVEAAMAPPSLRRWARACVERGLGLVEGAPPRLLYARVDAVETAAGPLLMELELIEPQLFLGVAPGAAGRFASALLAAVDTG